MRQSARLSSSAKHRSVSVTGSSELVGFRCWANSSLNVAGSVVAGEALRSGRHRAIGDRCWRIRDRDWTASLPLSSSGRSASTQRRPRRRRSPGAERRDGRCRRAAYARPRRCSGIYKVKFSCARRRAENPAVIAIPERLADSLVRRSTYAVKNAPLHARPGGARGQSSTISSLRFRTLTNSPSFETYSPAKITSR